MDQLAEVGVVREESSTRKREVLMSLEKFEALLREEHDLDQYTFIADTEKTENIEALTFTLPNFQDKSQVL